MRSETHKFKSEFCNSKADGTKYRTITLIVLLKKTLLWGQVPDSKVQSVCCLSVSIMLNDLPGVYRVQPSKNAQSVLAILYKTWI